MADKPQQAGRFKASMPEVPGVSSSAPEGAGGWAAALNPTARLVVGIAAFLVVGSLVAYLALRPARRAAKDDRFAAVESGPAGSAAGAASAANPAAPTPGNVQSAEAARRPTGGITTQELTEPWSSRTFSFKRGLTGETVPAMIIRLPQGEGSTTQSYWAFSLKDPFGTCQLEFVKDLDRVSTEYGFQAGHPVLVNPCNRGVYDPLQMTSLPTGAWVRGAVVHGSALRPPLAIEIRIDGDQIIPVQME